MENLCETSTSVKPYIGFNAETGILMMAGRMEINETDDSKDFWQRITNWL